MKKISKLLIVLLLAGCGPAAHIEKNDAVDFSKYKTYQWSEPDNQQVKKRYSNSLLEQGLKETVNARLNKEGWKEVNDNPDVLVSYDVLVERSTVRQSDPVYSNGFYRSFYNPYRRRYFSVYYPSRFLGYEEYSVPVKEGTITITMTDAGTDKTIWQGWSTSRVESKNLTREEAQSSAGAIIKKFKITK